MKSYATNDKGGTRLPSELERRSKSVALKNKKARKINFKKIGREVVNEHEIWKKGYEAGEYHARNTNNP